MILGCRQQYRRKHDSSIQKQLGFHAALMMLLVLLNVRAVASQQQAPSQCSSLVNIQLLANAEMFAAAIACNITDSSPDDQQCTQCQCGLIQALIPAVHQSSTSDQQGRFSAAQALLPYCLDTIAMLWLRLPNLTFPGLSNCKPNADLQISDCQQQPGFALAEVVSSRDAQPTASGRATTGASLSWDAMCTCEPVASNASALCNPQTLQLYTSECHARCLGDPDVAGLVPCIDLFKVGNSNVVLTMSTNSSVSQQSIQNNTDPYSLTDTEETDDGDASDDDNLTVYYYEDDDQPVVTDLQQTIPPDVLQAINMAVVADSTQTAASSRDIDTTAAARDNDRHSSSGLIATPNITDAPMNKTLTGLNQALTTASPAVAVEPGTHADMHCPWSAVQLYEVLGGQTLTVQLLDCNSMACIIARLDSTIKSSNLATKPHQGLTSCLPNLAIAILSSSGLKGIQQLQQLQGCPSDTMQQLRADCWLPLAFDSYGVATDNSSLLLNKTPSPSSSLINSHHTTDLARLIESLSILMGSNNSSLQSIPDMTDDHDITAGVNLDDSKIWQLSGYDTQMGAIYSNTLPQAQNTNNAAEAASLQAQSSFMFDASPQSQSISPDSANNLQDGGFNQPTTIISQGVAWPAFCACNHDFDPVCSRIDLRWFPNVCYATCQGLQVEDVGLCADISGQIPLSAGPNKQYENVSTVSESSQQSAADTTGTALDDDEYYVYYY